MSKAKIILASASPRRRELLAGMDIPFVVETADIPEIESVSPLHPTPADVAMANALAKAIAVAKSTKAADHAVLGADTVVALESRLFGKPASLDQAREFLQALSGKTHEVITGCALIDAAGGEQIFHDVTRVIFRTLTPEVVDRYLAAVHVLDKAGAYALQEHGDWIIERVEGSSSNVIGLPIERLAELFRQIGLF